MKFQGSIVAALAAAIMLFTACNRGQSAQSAPPPAVSGVRPAQQPAQAPAPAPTPAPSSPPASSASSEVARPKTEAPPANVVISDHSQTFTVAQQTFRFLTHVQKIEGKNDQTVEWWELRDANDRVVHRESYPVVFQDGTFESTTEISASSFSTKRGGGILVQGMDLPSAPGTGSWVQLFGFKYGRDNYGADLSLFMPFGPPISGLEGEFLELGTDSFRPSPVLAGGATAPIERDVLRFRLWTGNIHIVYPVQIDWISGKLMPAWRCFESTSKGRIERCSYPVRADAHREDQTTFVRLFSEPDEGFTPKHIVIRPQSKIEYLEARTPVAWSEDAKTISFGPDGDLWIKVRIDGAEGWIHSQEDFDAVGLPASG